jgi:hypothetical protein
MHKTTTTLICGLLTVLLMIAPSSAAEWGSIKGRFVADGEPPSLTPLVVNKDQFCIDSKPVNDTVVIGKDHALANAVVYLWPAPGLKVDIHPDYEAQLKKPVTLDNKNCMFHPHITTVRVGQKLEVTNSDPQPVSHNTNLALIAQNPVVPPGTKVEYTISAEGRLPSPVACNIHTWMKGYLLSLKHPYMAVSGEDGRFEIKNIPAGTHEFQFWHEAPGYLKNLKFKGGATDALRGRAKLKIAGGQSLDLGDIKVPARMLVPK